MRHVNFYFLFVCLFLCSFNLGLAQQLRSYSSDDGNFYLKSTDGHEEYTVNGTVTFKCVKSGTIPTYRDAGVTFAPANLGEIIQVKVESIDLDGSSNYLLLYNGYVKTGYSGASTGGNQSTYMPAGWLAKIGTSATGSIYTSESADGKFTFGFHSGGSASGQTGFNITVTSLSPKNMEFVSAETFLDSKTVNRGGDNQILLGANVKMDGSGNPQTLNELTFDTSLLSAEKIENLRIYSSDKFAENSLLATASSVGASLSIATSVELHNGDNKFYLVADIKPDALGVIPQSTVSSVKINDAVKTNTPSASDNSITIGNVVLITKVHRAYTIAEDTEFYDDGGKSNKISDKFEGSITFIPATPGKKIKIDFSKLEIFNTSSTGYNDVFKFYNGQTVDESNLIATLLKEAKIVKSTAEDGSLTVTLKSTTGIPANGWEAIVSEYLPGIMTFDALEVSSLSAETLAGGNSDEQFVLVNLKTTNTLTPIVLQSVEVNATGTTNISALSKAKIYYLGETNIFNTSSLFGESSVAGVSTTMTGTQELKEGNNYFALVYDLTSKVSNGDIISASVSKVTASGEDKAPQTALTVLRTAANIFKARKGSYTKEIQDVWTYTDTKSTIYPTLYDYEDADCYVTFRPTIAGATAELDFSAFDVYYSDSSYGVKAVFEVYSGSTVSQDNLLWKLSSNAQSKTGPAKKLRSVASDGSITVKFNPKAGSSSYAATGWTATVTPFVNHNMTVEDVQAFQTNTENLKPSSKNQEIIGFSVKTEGDLSAQTVKEIKIDLKGSKSVVDKVSVFYTADQKSFSSATLFGSTSDFSADETTIVGEQVLPEGVSYFWLAYDIKNVVPTDVQVDAKLLSIKTEDAVAYTSQNGDPDGYRLTKNEYLLSAGDNGQVSIYNPILFYDNGGADGEYTSSFDGKITFLPSEAGKVVKFTFNSFRTYSSHYFYIYNGTEVDENNLIGRYSSTTFPTSLFSTADNGALTVRFVSTSSGYTYAGWEIQVESYTTQDLFVEEIKSTPVSSADILRGSSKIPMQKIEVKVGGDKGALSVNGFKFVNSGTTNIADIASAKLYYTNTSSGFIADNQVGGEATGSPYEFVFSEAVRASTPGIYYFWLVYDIDADVTVGNKVTASLDEATVNGAISSVTEASPAERTVKAGFKGTYTIGKSGSANYLSFASAIAAMKDGVEGAVKFNVEAGTYAENIKISAIQGTSDTHNIVFTSLSGKNDDVIISGSGYSEPAYGDQKYGMVAVDSTNHVTFENMSFIPAVQTYPYAVHVLHVSRYFTLRNCVIKADPVVTGYSGMQLFYMEARNVEGNNNDYVTVENNSLMGGYIAFYMGGTGYVALTKERGAVIRNNTITNAGSKGIYVSDEQDAVIENNTVISSATQKTGYIGLDISRNRGALVIRNNKIVNNQSYYSTGINLRQELMGSADVPALVYNNSIAITASPNTSSYGFDVVSNCAYISLYNNTVSIAGNGGYTFGISSTYETLKGISLQNNLFQNTTSSPVFYINRVAQLKGLTFKNNAYYTAGTKLSNSAGDNLAAWKTATGDTDSFVEQAEFLSSSDLHLKSVGGLNVGVPISFISTDIEGKERSLTSPTIGAYEYEAIVEVKPEIGEGYPKTGAISYNSIEVKTRWNQSGKLYQIIKEASADVPSEAELLAITAVNLSSGEEYLSTFKTLKELTQYKAYFIFVSALDVKSDIVATESLQTEKQIFPLSVGLPETWQTVAAGTEVNLYPIVSGAVYPYAYEWRNQMNQTISTDSILTVSPSVVQQYTLIVTSSDNQTLTLRSDVLVGGQHVVATFEDNFLAPESYWQGLNEDGESTFYSGSYSFTNTNYPSYSFWGGFAYSNETSTAFDPDEFMTHQFRSVVGHGAEESNTYAIAYTMGAETKISVVNNEDGMIIPGVYLTNAAYALNSMQNGDSFVGDPFKAGDYLKVTFKGTSKTRATSTVEFYLADYRSAIESERYMLTDWKWFDLSSLGTVTNVTMSLSGSRTGDYGLNTPAYLCLDNFGAESPMPVGIDEDSKPLNIYPIPAVDVLNISTSAIDYSVRVYNLQGKVVLHETGLSEDSQIDVTRLSAGSYIFELNTQDGRQVRNFIKK